MEKFDKRINLLIQEELKALKLRGKYDTEDDGSKEIANRIDAVKRRLKTVSDQRSRLHDLLEQGVYDIATFMQRQKVLTEKQTAAEGELKDLTESLKETTTRINYDSIVPTMEHLLKNWDTMLPSDKNEVLKKIIRKISYKRTDKHIIDPDFETNVLWRF